MIRGGNVTVYVKDVDRSVRFYVETLGFKLLRKSAGWAEVDAGGGLVLGLLVASPGDPEPGARGSLMIGLDVTIPLAEAASVLENRGVRFGGPPREGGAVKLAFFTDPDGTPLYLVERAAT